MGLGNGIDVEQECLTRDRIYPDYSDEHPACMTESLKIFSVTPTNIYGFQSHPKLFITNAPASKPAEEKPTKIKVPEWWAG